MRIDLFKLKFGIVLGKFIQVISKLFVKAFWDLNGRMCSITFTMICILFIMSCSLENRKNAEIKSENDTAQSLLNENLLLFLPPVISAKYNSDTVSILLTTTDLARYDDKTELKPYVHSLQIIDADEPWPPRWYSALGVYTDEMHKKTVLDGQYVYNFILDAKIEQENLAFYKIVSKQDVKVSPMKAPEISGYILLNKQYEAVDTVTAGGHKRRNVFYHDFRINDRKERIVNLRKDSYIDLRDFTDNEKDSSVHCYVDYILVVDSNDKVIFSWNPLDHLNPELFNIGEQLNSKAMATLKTDIISVTRLTTAIFDYDDNIIFSMREMGIGKIARNDGRIIWHLDYTKIPIISGEDTIEWYSPHDVNLVSHDKNFAIYSVYSNGKNEIKNAEAVIFKLDKKSFEPSLIKKIKPHVNFVARGHGNIDYDDKNGEYLMSYGNLTDEEKDPDFRIDLEYGKGDSIYGLYKIPKYNSIYKAHKLHNWPRPPRPVINKKGEMIEVVGKMSDWVWYKLSGKDYTIVEKAGTGKTIKPEKGSAYCVEGKYGIGFSVSKIYLN